MYCAAGATTKFKLDISAFLYSCPVNPIDVVTFLMRGRPQAEAGNALSIYFIENCESMSVTRNSDAV